MSRDLNQFVLGAVVGAVSYEVITRKNPQLIYEIKQNVKGLRNAFKTAYKELEDIFKTATNKNEPILSNEIISTNKKRKRRRC